MICEKCILRKPGQVCGLTNSIVLTNAEECPHFLDSAEKCDICHRYFKPQEIVLSDNIITCRKCATLLGRCESCKYFVNCGLRNYQGTKPLYVMQAVQNGNMTIRQQVLNPEVVSEICSKCECGDREMCSANAGCGKYKCILEGIQ